MNPCPKTRQTDFLRAQPSFCISLRAPPDGGLNPSVASCYKLRLKALAGSSPTVMTPGTGSWALRCGRLRLRSESQFVVGVCV